MESEAGRANGTIDVNGLPIFYETIGEGPPLLLLHGGMGTNSGWDHQVAGLSPYRRLIAFERRSHGHTPDRDGPLTYQDLADETVAFLGALGLGPIDMVGWSDGGMIAFLVAVQHPELVYSLTLVGSGFSSDGYVAGSMEALIALPADDEALAIFAELYAAASPDGPEHFPVVWDKVRKMWAEPFNWAADLPKVQAPVLVVIGDDDFITVPHADQMARWVPHGQLAVVPGSSHLVPIERPELFNRLVLEFTDHPWADATMMPLRRRPS